MRDLFRIMMVGGLFLLATSVYAQDDAEEEVKLGWSGVGELGYVKTTGNTDSSALNGKLEFIRTTENWRYRFLGTVLTTSENGTKDNERYTAEAQADRKLDEKSYVFGVYRYDADKFGSYDPSQSATVGYGRELMKSENHVLKGEIGVGYRKLDERLTGESESDAILRFLLDDAWQVFKTTSWTNRLLVETGSNNTFTQWNTGLTVSMTDAFAIKVGFELRNNSKVPPGDTEKTDTITSVNLVYNF
jgi:putative salt-induced outer membrane protein